MKHPENTQSDDVAASSNSGSTNEADLIPTGTSSADSKSSAESTGSANNKFVNSNNNLEAEKLNTSTESSTENTAIDSKKPVEYGGPKGPEPTRYGDWERKGRCVDF